MNQQTGPTAIQLRDFFRFDFYRQLSRLIWLFFPAILFLIAAFFCFWDITQGKDLMVITKEKEKVYGYMLLALLFWTYTSWYTSRAVGKAKRLSSFLHLKAEVPELQHESSNYLYERLTSHLPRLLAFSCFTLILLAFLQLKVLERPIAPWLAYFLLAFSIPYYLLLFQIARWLCDRPKQKRMVWLQSIRITTWAVLFIWFLIIIFSDSFFWVCFLMIAMQAGLVLLLVVRRKILEAKDESFYKKDLTQLNISENSSIWEKLRLLLFDPEDRIYFAVFGGLAILAMVIYVNTIFNVRFAGEIGSFPFVLLAFSVLLILGNVVAFFSVLYRFNLHLVLFCFAVIVGMFNDPHYVNLTKPKTADYQFSQRQSLLEFSQYWLNDSARRKAILASADSSYPVYFVLANGGASRSGYWVASVLSKLQDQTGGEFSRHLFCLSGASGGSVGTASFFSLLRADSILKQQPYPADSLYQKPSRDYLSSDFLTFTLARMLGPDVFRHLMPFTHDEDRAAALTTALERAAEDSNFLYKRLGVSFSEISTRQNHPYPLPIICINTTSMQDGNPAVVSNIRIDEESIFTNRIDVLKLLRPNEDLKLSSAVVLGASFPYVSPAGRIDSPRKNPKSSRKEDAVKAYYFVDGGYFDNSGAGVVNEMIIALKQYADTCTDIEQKQLFKKIRLQVLHITNEPRGYEGGFKKVNPLVNDLAAPMKTLLGSYGSQTTVNDGRLKTFMRNMYATDSAYTEIPLYRYQEDSIKYSMNWVISDWLRREMDNRLNDAEIKGILLRLQSEMERPAQAEQN